MIFGKQKKNTGYQHMYSLLQQHMNQYVLVETIDGQRIDGVVTGLDQYYAYLAVPLSEDSASLQGYGFQPYMQDSFQSDRQTSVPKRFTRYIIPLSALVNSEALPWY
ncbi:hypothetical protein N781_15280 [Pontibacillus halophilus JSM 076056 = DSM 19796]|uniref:Uncharacterized protein n=1 Tax=Pontibacillus halophilus JSM 076056 = DSM 19796 TaxID=1385510 RepID=A0A0A5IAD0_9BACI|nr:hypothetical protein [Pontibacillus halophilus]KGX92792.1 hypothetical protein N781_15280 [Pontibacillus halophilus JSM 076056 = DSM 19796]